MRNSLLVRAEATAARPMTPKIPGQMIDAAHYRDLLISHRRMERLAVPEQRLRGLRDLDTGEVFLIDERRLFDSRR
jgi:hypothetical protein